MIRPDLSAWGLPEPLAVRTPDRGTNNQVLLIDDAYVLRVYQNLDAARIESELRLLEGLDAGGALPCSVPRAIRAQNGERVVHTESGSAVLFRYLPGRPADRSRLSDVEMVGEALGRLDAALAQLPLHLAPMDWRVSLNDIHPAVPSVADLCSELERALPGAAGVRLLGESAAIDEEYLRLTRELPVQIIHNDLAASNVLIGEDGLPTAILDFEVAGLDIRVNDLVAGLAMSVDWGTARQADQEAAFRRGYRRIINLEPAEEAALAVLGYRRAIGSVIWRAGRWRSGLSELNAVRDRLAMLPYARSTGEWIRSRWAVPDL